MTETPSPRARPPPTPSPPLPRPAVRPRTGFEDEDTAGEVEEPEEYDPDLVRALLGERRYARAFVDPVDAELLLARAVAQLLFAHRRLHRLTQGEQASRLGVSQAWISRAQSGRHPPTWRTLVRVARATGSRITVELAPGEAVNPVAAHETRAPLAGGQATVRVDGPRRPAFARRGGDGPRTPA